MRNELTIEERRRLADNLASVREQIANAASRAGRKKEEITLVAVTKYVSSPFARALYDLGCVDLGESRPQELWSKADSLKDCAIRWHLIGHLQRNKLRRTLPLVSLLHSVDRESLLADLDKETAQFGQQSRFLLEVNISGDASKHGFAPGGVKEVLKGLSNYPHLNLAGLMGMSGLESDTEVRRREFASLRELSVACGIQGELSMGMSDDFPIAIEEGATLVRVGSALFEGVTN